MAQRVQVRVRWFLSFLGVIALPFLIGTVIFIRGERLIRREMDRVHQAQLSVFVQGLDTILKEIRTLEVAMVQDPELRRLITGGFARSDEFLAARSLINRYGTQSLDLRTSVEWIVYSWETGRILAPSAYTHDSNFLHHDLFGGPPWALAQWRQQMRALEDRRFALTGSVGWKSGGDGPVLVYARLLPGGRPGEARAVLAFSVSTPLVSELLRSMVTGADDAVVVHDGMIPIVFGDVDADSALRKPESFARVSERPEVADHRYTVYREQSAHMPVTVYYVVGERGAFGELRAHRIAGVIALLVCLVAAVALSAFLVIRNYSPVRRLLELIMESKSSPVRAASDEFRVIESTLVHAMDETDELRALVLGHERSLDVYRFRTLLRGVATDPEADALALLRSSGVAEFIVVLIDPVSSDRTPDLAKLVEATLPSAIRVVDRVLIEDALCVVAGSPGRLDPDRLSNAMTGLLHAVHARLGHAVALAVSAAHPVTESPRAAVVEAQSALAYRIVEGTATVLKPHLATMARETFEFTLQQEGELTNMILAGDFAGAQTLTVDILERNFEARSLSIEMGRCLAFSLATMIIRCLNRVARYRENHIWDQLRPIDRIASCATYEELRATIIDLLRVVCLDIERNRQSHGAILVAQIVEFIEGQLRDPNLGTKAIADRFDMNPAYLGRVFKEQQGGSFSDYINRRRIEISKEMLKATDRTLADIGAELGYTESSSFIRFFRKFEGVTPGQYREGVS